MDDQAELVEQARLEQTRDHRRPADDVDRAGPPACLKLRISSIERTIRAVGQVTSASVVERTRCSVVRRNLRVGDLARIRVATEQLRHGRVVVEHRRPELLVSGKHPGAENEPVHGRQQLEPVRPRVDPVRPAVRVEDPAVERRLQDGDQVREVEVVNGASYFRGFVCATDGCTTRRPRATGSCTSLLAFSPWRPTRSSGRSSSTRRRASSGRS